MIPMLQKKMFVCLVFLLFVSTSVRVISSSNRIADSTTVTVSRTAIVGPPPNINDTFKIYINVEDVTDLAGYAIGMEWNPTVLNCTDFDYNDTFITGLEVPGAIDNTAGKAYPPYGLVKPIGGVNGSGTLLHAVFLVKAYGESPLNLIVDGLVDSSENDIPFNVVNGTFSLLDEEGPIIGNPVQNPETNVMPDEAVTVSVNVTDNVAVQNVILSYSNDTGTTWHNVTMTNTVGDTWEGDIPGHLNETVIQYMIIAYDTSNNPTVKNNAGSYYVYTVVPEFSTAIIIPMLIVLLAVAVLAKKLRPRT